MALINQIKLQWKNSRSGIKPKDFKETKPSL
jgi:hypothetical protein